MLLSSSEDLLMLGLVLLVFIFVVVKVVKSAFNILLCRIETYPCLQLVLN